MATNEQHPRISIDDVVESASAGVLRALGARDIAAKDFARDNGFSVRFIIEAGGFPIDQIALRRGSEGPAG